MMSKYILLDTSGELYDKLVKYIKYHSLSDLLVELMQLNLRFESLDKTNSNQQDGSSQVDEDEEGRVINDAVSDNEDG